MELIVTIPRSINTFADAISKSYDLHDYSVTDSFFQLASNLSKLNCNIDRFANNLNTKLSVFNSASFCVGTSGVDAFKYSWSKPFVNWLFPPPHLVLRTMNKLIIEKGIGLLVVPEWKSADFYPCLLQLRKHKKNEMWNFKGTNVFETGIDTSSYFGPEFNCAVNLWKIDFS